MIICGAEEPVQVNPFFSTLIEDMSQAYNSHFSFDGLNRYAFVNFGEEKEAQEAFSMIVQYIYENHTPSYWLWAFGVPMPYNQTSRNRDLALRWTEQKYNNLSASGWDTRKYTYAPEKDVYIALRELAWSDFSEYKIAEFTVAYEARTNIILCGKNLSIDDLVTSQSVPTLKHMAAKGTFAPSANFFKWMFDKEISVVFNQRDVLEHPALCVITATKLPLYKWSRLGLINEIENGDQAIKVWSRRT